jgi:histidine ammonia-lyase
MFAEMIGKLNVLTYAGTNLIGTGTVQCTNSRAEYHDGWKKRNHACSKCLEKERHVLMNFKNAVMVNCAVKIMHV